MGSPLRHDRGRLIERHSASPHVRTSRRSQAHRAHPAEPVRRIARLGAEQPAEAQPHADIALALLERPQEEPHPHTHRIAARHRVLIVDDDPKVVRMIRDSFELSGDPSWALEATSAGQHALDLALASPPDVVLLDVSLPDLDGAEVYRRLRSAPQTSDARILFLSGDTSLALSRRGIHDGVLLRKPFDVEELVSFVRALLDG